MRLGQTLAISFLALSLAGCTTVASKDDVYLLKSSMNEELAQLKTDVQRLQEQVQEMSQTVDFVEKDTTNQILNMTTEVYDRVTALENAMAQDKAATSQKMDLLLNEVARVEQKRIQTYQASQIESTLPVENTPVIPENAISYTVRTGDTLSKIAAKYGISKEQLIAANGIQDENYLAIGDVLLIPQE